MQMLKGKCKLCLRQSTCSCASSPFTTTVVWAGPAAMVSLAMHCATLCWAAFPVSGASPVASSDISRLSKAASWACEARTAGKKASTSSRAAPCNVPPEHYRERRKGSPATYTYSTLLNPWSY